MPDASPPPAGPVLDAIPDAVVTVDLDGIVRQWNAGATRLFGWTAEEVLGRPLPTVPDDLRAERRLWLEAAAKGDDEDEHLTSRLHRDGHRVDVTLRMAPLRDDGGEVAGWVGILRDAGPQLRMVRRLFRRESELLLVRRLTELSQGLIEDLDLDRVLAAIVEAGLELSGASAGVVSLRDDDGIYRRRANVNIPADLIAHPIVVGEGMHGTVLATGEPLVVDDYDTWEHGVAAFQGRGYHASAAVPICVGDRIVGVLSVHADDPAHHIEAPALRSLTTLADHAGLAITNAGRYRQAEEERTRFAALLDAMADGLAVVERGVVTGWNRAATALTGLAPEEVVGHPPPFDLEAAEDVMELRGDDGSRWVQAVSNDLPGGTGTVWLLRDVTEQHRLDQAKNLFFATTSHELKTPLTVVKGLAATLRRYWDKMSEEQRLDALATIERRAEHLHRLIERILVGSRVEAGVLDLHVTPVDLRMLIGDIVEGFAGVSPNHEIVGDVPDDLPPAAGDRQAVDTILGHLLENAVKYSPGGGEVRVSARATDDEVVVDVADRGVGIEGELEDLLRPFVQADNRATRRFGGVGLGLYIVRRILDDLGGNLWATPRDGGGTVFTFTLPRWGAAGGGER